MTAPTQDVMSRFMAKVLVADSGCWNWTSTLSRGGYGKFWLIDRQAKAHAVAYELFSGPTNWKWVLHKCDNRKCVNPSHLYLGDAKQNAKDRTDRQRWSVWTPFSVVVAIRDKYASGSYTQQQLASEYGINQTQVSRYVLNQQRQFR